VAVVEVETRGDVAVIWLDRPEKLNAISVEMLDGLLDAVESIGRSDGIGAAVLAGRGRAFSTGGDIAQMHGMDERQFADTISRYMRVSAAFRSCPKPIIAAVHGYALAGGFELALCVGFALSDTALGVGSVDKIADASSGDKRHQSQHGC